MHLYHAIFVVIAVMQTVSTLSYNFFISRNFPDNCCYNPRDKLSRDWGVYYPTTPPPSLQGVSALYVSIRIVLKSFPLVSFSFVKNLSAVFFADR